MTHHSLVQNDLYIITKTLYRGNQVLYQLENIDLRFEVEALFVSPFVTDADSLWTIMESIRLASELIYSKTINTSQEHWKKFFCTEIYTNEQCAKHFHNVKFIKKNVAKIPVPNEQ